MKEKVSFLTLIVSITILFLAGCESILPDPEEELNINGLFLKFSPEEEMSSYYLDENGTISRFYYPRNRLYVPNSLLFEINNGFAKIVNSFLDVKNYKILPGNKEAVFWIDRNPVLTEGIVAFRLPFTRNDFGAQSEKGNDRFNGLLKTNFYVFAVKKNQILIYDINSEDVIKSEGVFNEDDFIFTVNSEVWTLTFMQTSPIGNFFEFIVLGEAKECFTLMN
jgi:hypothetical protein